MTQLNRKNESGRSMVEMLGVLAIIGVLSVGGIMGYTTAMRKYQANEIAQAITMTVMAAKSANMGYGISASANFTSLTGESSYPQGCVANGIRAMTSGGKLSYIRLQTNTPELCSAVQSIIGSDHNQPMYVNMDSGSTNSCETHNTDSQTIAYITVK